MNLFQKIQDLGVAGCARRIFPHAKHLSALALFKVWHEWRVRNAPRYNNPSPDDLYQIEFALRALDVEVKDYCPSVEGFRAFQAQNYFPDGYHGGRSSEAWDEKLLEHWIASERLGLFSYGVSDVYVDVAAGGSPWAQTLKVRNGIDAYAIDLEVGEVYKPLAYYRIENAKATTFPDASVKGASLHCAYEMFVGNDDIQFIKEIARFLAPGGKVVILPLYMHTHYCFYSTPEFFGKVYSDPMATEYVRLDCMGVPYSRKYNASMLKSRVLDTIVSEGMSYSLFVLRNKNEFGKGIYCHFILEICK